MIICNGTMELRTAKAGGIDPETGYPIRPAESQWGNPIPCQYSANKYDRLGKADGEHFTIASYSILIDEQAIDEKAELRLRDCTGKELGKYHIMEIEPLPAVCQLRIIV